MRIFTVFLCILILSCNFTGFAMAQSVSTASGTVESKASLLSDLGIIEMNENEQYDLKKALTVSEFAQMMSALNFGENTVLDATASPDSNVTVSEVACAIIKVLGYEIAAEQKSESPSGYVSQAIKLGIFKNLDISNSNMISREQIIQIIYNALSINKMVSDYAAAPTYNVDTTKTILNDNLKVSKRAGIIFSAQTMSLPSNGNRNAVLNGIVYETTLDNIEIYDGLSVTAYLKKDCNNKDVIVHVDLGSNDIITVNAEDIVDYSNNKLNILKNDRKKSLFLAADKQLIYNGELLTQMKDVYFTPLDGYLELIDNDNDSLYDVVRIYEQETLVVKHVDAANGRVYDLYDADKVLQLDVGNQANYKIISGDDILSLNDLRKYDVLTVQYPKNGENVMIMYSPNYTFGVITEIADDYVIIDDIKYLKSCYYNTNDNKKLNPGEEAFFHLDIYNRVVCIEDADDESEKYGYFIDIAKVDGLLEKTQIKLLDKTGAIQILDLSKAVTVNGVYTKNTNIDHINPITTALKTQKVKDSVSGVISNVARSFFVRQPIIYKCNDKNEINYIDTALEENGEGNKNLRLDNTYTVNLNYKSWPMQFSDAFGIGMSTLIFYVPINENSVDASGNLLPDARSNLNDNDYLVRDTRLFKDNKNYKNFEAYDVTDGGMAKMLVYYYNAPASKSLQDIGGQICIVDKITKAINPKGEEASKIYMYRGGVYTSYFAANDDVLLGESGNELNLQRGDVIQIDLSPLEEITALRYKYDPRTRTIVAPDESTDAGEEFRGRDGIVYSKDEYGIRILENNSIKTFMTNHVTAVYIFDVENDKITVGTKDDIIDMQTSDSDASFVYLHTSWGSLSNIIIIK